jgi:hypothetical protein
MPEHVDPWERLRWLNWIVLAGAVLLAIRIAYALLQ